MKRKHWPLPKDDFECMCVLDDILYNRLPSSKYKIMIRKHNYAYGAIIEDTNYGKFDSQYGKKLSWIKGYIHTDNGGGFSLENYEEPREQKVAGTGELRDTIISENPMFIICSRNSQSLNDDEDNFTHEVNENDVRQVMQMRDFDSTQKIAIADLTEKIGEKELVATNLRTQAEVYGNEMKKLQGKVNLLQTRNLDLEDQLSELYRQNKLLTTDKLRDEAYLHAKEMAAEELGHLQGTDKIEVYKQAGADVKEFRREYDALEQKDQNIALYEEIIKKIDQFENKSAEVTLANKKVATANESGK